MRISRIRRAAAVLGAILLVTMGAPRAEAAVAPIGNFESITATFNGIKVKGWALDQDTTASIDVHIYVNNTLVGAGKANLPRPDVDAVYHKGPNHGFDFYVPSPGGTVCAYAINFGTGSPNTRIGCKSFPATARPIGVLDSTPPDHNGIRVIGWALDPDTSASIDVHVYVNGRLAAAGTANLPRPDVDAVHHKGPNHGFNLHVPTEGGTVCVYALNFGGGVNPVIACKDVPASASPIGNIDSLTPTSGGVMAHGWALDPDTNASIDVHAYFNERLVASDTADLPRSDVEAIYHKGLNHGFNFKVPTSGPGVVCIFALNFGGGYNTLLGCRQV